MVYGSFLVSTLNQQGSYYKDTQEMDPELIETARKAHYETLLLVIMPAIKGL